MLLISIATVDRGCIRVIEFIQNRVHWRRTSSGGHKHKPQAKFFTVLFQHRLNIGNHSRLIDPNCEPSVISAILGFLFLTNVCRIFSLFGYFLFNRTGGIDGIRSCGFGHGKSNCATRGRVRIGVRCGIAPVCCCDNI